jgi:hypothetical protein
VSKTLRAEAAGAVGVVIVNRKDAVTSWGAYMTAAGPAWPNPRIVTVIVPHDGGTWLKEEAAKNSSVEIRSNLEEARPFLTRLRAHCPSEPVVQCMVGDVVWADMGLVDESFYTLASHTNADELYVGRIVDTAPENLTVNLAFRNRTVTLPRSYVYRDRVPCPLAGTYIQEGISTESCERDLEIVSALACPVSAGRRRSAAIKCSPVQG